MSGFSATLAAVAGVEGWMTDAQAQRLWDRARAVEGNGRIVEIGSFRGRSTIVLATAAGPDAEVVAIDPHAGNDRGPQEIEGFVDEAEQDHDVFHANLRAAGVDERVRHVRRFSDDALDDVDGAIDLLYIDGAHRFQPALADIRRWGARVAPGGTLLIHDSFSSIGVTLALRCSMVLSREFRYVGRSTSMAEYRRQPVVATARAANAGRQLAQLPWFARNVLIKVLITAKLGRLTRYLGHHTGDWPY
jgi:predicted O-methyltransferase YrrM